MGIICAGATDIGRKRKSNQDSIYLDSERQFFAVADGMGGHNGGDIASQLTVKLIPEFFDQNTDLEPSNLLKKMISHVNTSILAKASEDPNLSGMGTTISAMLFAGPQLHMANVGDSRVYLINHDHIFQLTRDHSFVQEKLNLGIYTRKEALEDPQKNVLIRSVGFESDLVVDVFQYRICKNDIFMICSDGLHGKVSDHDILATIRHHIPSPALCQIADVQNAVDGLIQLANSNGGQDNISVILAVAQA